MSEVDNNMVGLEGLGSTAQVDEEAPVVQNDSMESTSTKDGKSKESKETTEETDDDTQGDMDDALFQFMTGIKEDIHARAPYYKDDWGMPRNPFTVINATVFAFVIQLIPALIFAELMDDFTEGNLAIAEVLMSSALIGVIYAIFAGQPLVIMGITGPVAILLGTSYGLAEKYNAEYFAFFFWTCLWAGIMHMGSAMVGLVSLVWKVTPFTSQIFELFIAVTFIYASLRELIEPMWWGQGTGHPDRTLAYASFFIGLLTFYIAWTLHFAETWVYFTRQVRVFLTSYNTLIAVVVATAFSYCPGIDQSNVDGGIERVNIRFYPWDWQPTADRNWVVNPLAGISVGGIFAAILPGFMFFLLFIIDHNVSSILTQSPKFNLKKPSAYHLDFFVLGITFIPCAILGLPPGNGLIPQAPLHCRALCTRKIIEDEYGVRRETFTNCEEQRWSGLGQACLMFAALAAFVVLSWIPRGCLFGLFLYLGVGALHGNEIWERVTFCAMIKKKRPAVPVVREVKWMTTVWWTFIQVCCAGAIFAVAQFASVGYIYPALLTALVPFRSYVLDRLFSSQDLRHLDPFGDDQSEEDYHKEQIEIRMAEHRSSLDSEELNPPNRAEFRGQGKLRVRRNTIPPAKTEEPHHVEWNIGVPAVDIVDSGSDDED